MTPNVWPSNWMPTDIRNSSLMPSSVDIGAFGQSQDALLPSVFNTPQAKPAAVALPKPPTVSFKNSGSTAGTSDPTNNQGWLGKTFMNDNGGLNLSNIGLLVEGIGTLGSLWSAFQANDLAKDQLNFQKSAWDKNYSNQVSSYNTALEDRAYSRAAQKGHGTAVADAYINKHKIG